jgi:LmbE family N-acetylglucosaminyl deacetylase
MKLSSVIVGALLATGVMAAQQDPSKIRVIAFGAHPDDCDIRASGTAALFAKMGHAVKFVSVTNGDAGHQDMGGGALAKRRLAEAKESARRLGIAYDVLENHDGELMPTLEVRRQVIREIREWQADIVIAPRSNDYHPDHRYTGVLIQDASYMVVVPNLVPDVPALKNNPVFLYYQDGFQRPNPFRPDIVVDIDEVFDKKIDALDSHVSQFYEWLPWVDHKLEQVPKDPVERKKWLASARYWGKPSMEVEASLEKWYGPERAHRVVHAEAFEVTEYGRQPSEAQIRALFPMLVKR